MLHSKSKRRVAGLFGACIIASFSAIHDARADEGGVSFWVPGFFGSLAAAPQQSGWSFTTFYYHTSVSAGADVAIARERTLNRIPVNLNLNASLNASLSARADLQFMALSYTAPAPVFGGQASFYLMGTYGRVDTSLGAQLSGTLTASAGGVPLASLPFSRFDSISDTSWGFGDLIPMATLRWNNGVNNYMTYITGDIPVGRLRSRPPVQYRHRPWRDRCRRRLHLSQSADRPRILRCPRLHLQFRQPVDPVSERCRLALRLGLVAIPDQASSRSAWSAMSTRRSAATAAPAIGSAASSRRWSASARRSVSSSRSATCRAISISKAIGNSPRRTGPMAGMPGSRS